MKKAPGINPGAFLTLDNWCRRPDLNRREAFIVKGLQGICHKFVTVKLYPASNEKITFWKFLIKLGGMSRTRFQLKPKKLAAS